MNNSVMNNSVNPCCLFLLQNWKPSSVKSVIYLCEQVLFVRFYNNPAPVNGSTQFHYCTVSNPGTGADDAFVLLKRGV